MTSKQLRFIEEYLIDGNASKAAVRAGYSAKNSEKVGWEVLQIPAVREAIEAKRAEVAKKFELTRERLVGEYVKIGFADPSKYFKVDENGLPYIDMRDMGSDDWAAVASVQTEEAKDGKGPDARDIKKSKVTLSCKKSALDSIAKIMGWSTERVQHLYLQDETVYNAFTDAIGELLGPVVLAELQALVKERLPENWQGD